MSCCMGFFKKKRGKSLPPGGTQVKDNNKRKLTQPIRPVSNVNTASLPNIDLDEISKVSQKTVSKKNDVTSNEKSSKLSPKDDKDDETIENEMYPPPLSFREPSKSIQNDSDEDYTKSKQETTRDQDTDILNEFNKDLQKELKQTLTKQSMNETKSPRSISSQSAIGALVKSTKQIGSFDNDLLSAGTSFNIQQQKLNQTQNTVIFKQDQENTVPLETMQKMIDGLNVDKNLIESLKADNKSLRTLNEQLQAELLDREFKTKEENDFLIATVHNTLSKDLRTDTEKEALIKLFLSKQTEKNEDLIKEQSKVIEHLKQKCDSYEKELKFTMTNQSNQSNQDQVQDLKSEISALRNVVYRLNVELSSYQSKYPTPGLQSSLKKIELSGLPLQGVIPIWLVNTKYLSPLVAAYDDKIVEKDDKLKQLKKKIDDLTSKFNMILDENNQLQIKLEKSSFGVIGSNDPDVVQDIKNIKHHALLVLEENKALNEQIELQHDRQVETQRQTIIEIANLSKRIIVNEAEKTDFKNQIETLKMNYDELLKKYNDAVIESQRRVRLQDHLNQIGDLKKKIDEMEIYHKHEIDQAMNKIQLLETEKKDLTLKNASLATENKKLVAENQVLDKALNEGIGRKVQRKVQDLEKKLELAQMNEKTVYECLEKLTKDCEKLKQERDTFENMVKTSQIEMKKNDNKLTQENLKYSKLENKLQEMKEKTAEKISGLTERLKQKDSEFLLVKLENDKKITDLLNLLHKKQDQIDDLIQEKRQMEGELEMVWQSATTENRRLKESLLDSYKHVSNDHMPSYGSSHHKLLIDD